MRVMIVLYFLSLSGVMSAQSFSATVSQDTILMGHILQLNFQIQNMSGEFEAPKLAHFYQVGGVSHSSSISIVNGQMSQTQTYTYQLEPKEEGLFIIEPAFLHTGDDVKLTDPIQILVLPNPDGKPQREGRQRRSPAEREQPAKQDSKPKRPVTRL